MTCYQSIGKRKKSVLHIIQQENILIVQTLQQLADHHHIKNCEHSYKLFFIGRHQSRDADWANSKQAKLTSNTATYENIHISVYNQLL